jgi:hypothetical protein
MGTYYAGYIEAKIRPNGSWELVSQWNLAKQYEFAGAVHEHLATHVWQSWPDDVSIGVITDSEDMLYKTAVYSTDIAALVHKGAFDHCVVLQSLKASLLVFSMESVRFLLCQDQ